MKNLIIGLVTITTLLFSCSPDNPNPNGNGSQTYTQGTPITDIDGNTYPTIISDCGQTWTAKNLNVSRYRNGELIPQVTDPSQWSNLTTGAWCYSNNVTANSTIYGKLYNWYAVNDPRGLAPSGYHVPSDGEWNKLVKCIDQFADTTITQNQSTIAGGAMKEAGLTHWLSPNTGATNSSGFTGLPGGTRNAGGSFGTFGGNGFWWTSTDISYNYALFRYLDRFYDNMFRNDNIKTIGFSVRCIKD